MDQVGLDDSFFELGGNSLLATALATGVVESFSLSLPLRTLLESGTVRAMAGAILAELAARADAERLAAALDALGLPPEAEAPSAHADQPAAVEISAEPRPYRAPEAST